MKKHLNTKFKNHRAFQLFSLLDKKELRQCAKFVRSPFYNTDPLIVRLFEVLRKFHPTFQSNKLTKRWLFEKLFEVQYYDAKRMRNLLSDLSLILEKFLIAMSLNKDKDLRQDILIATFAKRNFHPSFEKAGIKRMTTLKDKDHKNLNDYHSLQQLNHQYYFHPDTRRFQVNVPSAAAMMNHLDHYFILGKLRYACELTARQNILMEKYHIKLLEEILPLAKKYARSQGNLLFFFYYQILKLHQKGRNDILFKKIVGKLKEKLDLLDSENQGNIFSNLQNHAIRLYNSGNRKYLRELVALYQLGVKHKVYISNERIKDSRFTNMAITSSGIGEYEWAKVFIEKHQHYLDPEFRSSALNLSWAYWHFHQNDFAEALQFLREIDYLPAYAVRIKALRIRALFELAIKNAHYEASLVLNLKSFRQFIRRNTRWVTSRKEAYSHFIYFIHKIWHLEQKKKRKATTTQERKLLWKEIKDKPNVATKGWLMEKAGATKNRP